MSALKIDLTDSAIKFIIEDFVSNPQRAKNRRVSLFLDDDNEIEFDENTTE